MEIKLLKSSILSNTIPQFLVFIENEPTLCDMYLKSISSTLGMKTYSVFSFDEFVSDTAVEREDRIYVIRGDDSIVNSEKCVEILKNSGKYVFLCYAELDKSCWLYKSNKDLFVVFNKLDKYTLVAYAKKRLSDSKVTIDQDKLVELADRCNCNLGIFLNEVDKIITLGDANTNLLVDYMMKSGFSDYRDADMFVLLNDFLNGDKRVVCDLVKLDDSPTAIVYNAYNLSRKRFLNRADKRYLKIMKTASRLFNSVVEGSIPDMVALKCLLLEGVNG